MANRKSNKKVKQMICDVINRNGYICGYYSLKNNEGKYCLRKYGAPMLLSTASRIGNLTLTASELRGEL